MWSSVSKLQWNQFLHLNPQLESKDLIAAPKLCTFSQKKYLFGFYGSQFKHILDFQGPPLSDSTQISTDFISKYQRFAFVHIVTWPPWILKILTDFDPIWVIL